MNQIKEEIIWEKTKMVLKPLEDLKAEIDKLYDQTRGYSDGRDVVIYKQDVEQAVLDINYKLSRLERAMFKAIAEEEK